MVPTSVFVEDLSIMSRFRSRWLALFGGVTLLALSLSTAFAGKPDSTHPGVQVSAYVHSLVGDVEETSDETTDDTEATDDSEVVDDTETEESAPSDHGTCVAKVAQGEEVGGDNETHGGAVSEAARVTCWDDSAGEEANTEEPTEDTDDSDVEETDAADPSAGGSDHGKGHGHGHGGDSSED
jgi:hypothetical protein